MKLSDHVHLGIIGYPIRHALSPLMHNTAIRELGLDCEYHSIEIRPENLARDFRKLVDDGYTGLNVTLPHKQSVIGLLDEVDPTAQAIGAVNTIRIREGLSVGYNTDALGFLTSVEPVADAFASRNVLLLGSGGAARAVLYGIVTRFHPSEIIVAGRNPSKCEKLVRDFAGLAREKTSWHTIGLDGREIDRIVREATVIINTTPVGMSPHEAATPLPHTTRFFPHQVAIDVVYNPIETMFLRTASLGGARTLDGLGMLIYQGMAAFEIFTGHTMPVAAVRSALEGKLGKK